jgi:hypothetical protein
MSYHHNRILPEMAAMIDPTSSDSTASEVGRGGHLLYMFVKPVKTGQNDGWHMPGLGLPPPSRSRIPV